MTQEEKQLLLQDLSARMPYNVKVLVDYIDESNINDTLNCLHIIGLKNYSGDDGLTNIRPYLRPMSSMTGEEKEEVEVFIFNKWYQENSCKVDAEGWIEILANYDVSGIDPCFCSDYVDWLNAHHFDYRGLIEKGLALEAPEDMYI